jgi:hypothetical protein
VDATALNDRSEEHPCWSLSNRPHEDKIVIVGIGVIDSPARVERHARLADHLLHEVVIGKDLYEERLELRTLEAVQLIVGSDESGCQLLLELLETEHIEKQLGCILTKDAIAGL